MGEIQEESWWVQTSNPIHLHRLDRYLDPIWTRNLCVVLDLDLTKKRDLVLDPGPK